MTIYWCQNQVKDVKQGKNNFFLFGSESESNRTFPVRVQFGSTEFLKSRFGFGSVELSKSEFEFGSVRLNF